MRFTSNRLNKAWLWLTGFAIAEMDIKPNPLNNDKNARAGIKPTRICTNGIFRRIV